MGLVRVGSAALLLLSVGCVGQEPSGTASAALVAAEEPGPGWLDGARVVDHAGGWRLWAGRPEAAAPQTDLRPAIPMAVATGSGWLLPPEPVLAGRLTDRGVIWVTVGGSLLADDGDGPRELDTDVIPELDVSPDGSLIAYARRPGPDAGVYALAAQAGAPRKLTWGLASADRPLFVDDQRLIVVGARSSGIAGVWVVRARAVDPSPRQLTNAGLVTGRPLGPDFIPPPAFHERMRVEQDTLVYDDGEGERRVSLEGVP